MQILLPKTAFMRIEARLEAVAPDLEVTLITPQGTFQRNGEPIPQDRVDPDIAWLASDAMTDGYLSTFLAHILKCTRTQWVQSFLAGHDRPIFRDIIARGVRLSKSSAPAIAIAEYVTAHAFSLMVPIEAQRAAQRRREWIVTPFREISESRWVVVGFGAIGSQIIKRVKAYETHVTVVRRQVSDPGLGDVVVSLPDIGKVLPRADVVVLACALNEKTRGLANNAFFERMTPGAILINVSRGALIDSMALKRGLDRDQPGHAVLDTFELEPLPVDNWMWTHPKIHVSAHTAAYGSGTLRRNDAQFLENLQRYLAGETQLNEVTRAEVGL